MQVKEVVQKASEYLPDVFHDAAGCDLRLEGVERTDDGRFWNITFSYSPHVMGSGLVREFKTVKLRNGNGELIGARNGMVLSEW